MPELPAHASPVLHATDDAPYEKPLSLDSLAQSNVAPPPTLLSPAFTPPSTPGTGTPAAERDALSIPVDTSAPLPAPELLNSLPQVECAVRARIPTTNGQEMFLHLYRNNIDNKEHLAIVFGSHIRSRSLDAVRPGETEYARMTRGAYTGRLYPGRTHSGMVPQTGTASPMHKSLHKPEAVHETKKSTLPKPHDLSTTSRLSPLDKNDEILRIPPVKGQKVPQAPLVRIHSECYTGETVWSARCDCGEQLDEAARLMSLPAARETGGVIVYLRQEGRGIGLSEKLKAYNLQDLGNDTVEANLLLRHPADARSYGLATAILVDLGLGRESSAEQSQDNALDVDHERPDGSRGIRLLTNNPDKIRAVEGPNREVIVRERVPMVPLAWRTGSEQGVQSAEVDGYLRTKVSKRVPDHVSLQDDPRSLTAVQIEKMGHMLQSG
ncbi:MAG: hypothetical protein Q9162_007398 [Coniocarpon cinnabarinum]